MKQFITQIFFFSLVLLGLLILDNYPEIKYYFTVDKKYLPAVKVSNSYPLNEKIRMLPEPQKKKILSIGSSMTLNNLSSNVITKELNTSSYINVGSNGFGIRHSSQSMNMFLELYQPNVVIICSNIMDFSPSLIDMDIPKIKDAIIHKKNINLLDVMLTRYYKNHLVNAKYDLSHNCHEGSLKYDEYGGIPLCPDHFKIDEHYWNSPLPYNVDAACYEDLSKLSDLLAKKSIQLVFIHPPIRTVFYNHEYFENITKHINKVKNILHRNHQTFVDLSNMKLSDSNFVDHAHLNSIGADSVTTYAFSILKEQHMFSPLITNN